MLLTGGPTHVAQVLHRPHESSKCRVISNGVAILAARQEPEIGSKKMGRMNSDGRLNWNTTQSTATPPILTQKPVSTIPLEIALTISPPSYNSPAAAKDLPTISHSQENLRPARSHAVIQLSIITAKAKLSLATSTPTVTIQAASNQTLASSTWPASTASVGANAQPKLDTGALPGINQNAPKLNMTSIPSSPAATIARPLPGKNQPKPILDDVAAASLVQFAEPWSSSTFTVSSAVPTTVASSRSTSIPASIQSTPIATLTSTHGSPSALPTSTSFVTFTKSQQGLVQASISSGTVSASQIALVTTSLSTSWSSILVVTSVIAIPTGQANLPATANAELRQHARLTPLARTLFIVFGALGKFFSHISSDLG